MKINFKIVIPGYKNSEYIEKCIQSVIDQTYPNWNALVIDDCSQDGSFLRAKEYSSEESRISIIENSK